MYVRYKAIKTGKYFLVPISKCLSKIRRFKNSSESIQSFNKNIFLNKVTTYRKKYR